MRFVFDEGKAAQAASHLIRRNGGRINYMVLIKLLYLTDRRSLLETGYSLTGDRMVSMPHGPVLSRIYDRINMGDPVRDGTEWYQLLTEPTHYEVGLRVLEPPADRLSRYDLRILDEVFDQFGGMDKWALRDYTHTLPEWVDPRGSSSPIEPEAILRAEGKDPEEIEDVVAEAEDVYLIRQLGRGVAI